MDGLSQEMLQYEFMLKCETSNCREFFEFDEVANEPMDDWARRATAEAHKFGWTVGHKGLVKCRLCAGRDS